MAAAKKKLSTLRKKGLSKAKAQAVKGGKMPTRHQANIKFGDIS